MGKTPLWEQSVNLKNMGPDEVIGRAIREIYADVDRFCLKTLIEVVDAGLKEGDRINVGDVRVRVLSGRVSFTTYDKSPPYKIHESRVVEMSELGSHQMGILLKIKAVEAAKRND